MCGAYLQGTRTRSKASGVARVGSVGGGKIGCGQGKVGAKRV